MKARYRTRRPGAGPWARRLRACLSLLAVVALRSGELVAASLLFVAPGDPGAYASLGAAVANAAPGDVIIIDADAVLQENVVVPADREGLVIVGMPGASLDGGDATALELRAAGVTVAGLAIANHAETAVGIAVEGAADVRIVANRFVGVRGSGVRASDNARRMVLVGNVFEGSGTVGAVAAGDVATIANNRFAPGSTDLGLVALGAAPYIQGNDVAGGLIGIAALGSDGQIRGNTVDGALLDAVWIGGGRHTFASNVVRNAAGNGFRVLASARWTTLTEDNQATNNAAHGFRVDEGAIGTAISGNTATANGIFDICDEGALSVVTDNGFDTECPRLYVNPVLGDAADLADPAVIRHDGVYYLYATGDRESYDVYLSYDLVHFARGPTVFEPQGSNVWAPDVFANPTDGRFYLYYTVDLAVGVASAESPLGPFVDHGTLVDGALDAHLFRSASGELYLYYAVFEPTGISIEVQPMATPVMPMDAAVRLLAADQAWELTPGGILPVNEAPWMVEHGETFYLFYSGNNAHLTTYGVGVATSNHPLGPFTKHATNPVAGPVGNVLGPGHCSVVDGPSGTPVLVYHQKKSATPGWLRDIAIDPLDFEDGVPVINPSRGVALPAP